MRPFFFLLLLLDVFAAPRGLSASAASLRGWAPTTAPDWYQNFPPWWISKVKDAGYQTKGKINKLVVTAPIPPPVPVPPAQFPQNMPKKLYDAMVKGSDKLLGYPAKAAEDTIGVGAIKNDMGALYTAITTANSHAKDRGKGGKPSPDLEALNDPGFNQKQQPKAFKFVETAERTLPAEGAYNVAQGVMWKKTNDEVYAAEKKRPHQALPLWDPYWREHPGAMPTMSSHALSENAYLNYKSSPLNLYYNSESFVRDGGGSSGSEALSSGGEASGDAPRSTTGAGKSDESDSWW
jgi:hypothetical protein